MAKEYDIAKASGCCRSCRRDFQAGEEFVAVLHDKGRQFEREDFCADCWEARRDEVKGIFSVWQSRVPTPEEPQRQFVSNQVLIEFFEKLDGLDEPPKVNCRFVLALMLMRKKLLAYDRAETDDAGREVWSMHFKSDGAAVSVVRPQLDDERIAEVSAQLGAIFEVPS